MYKKSSSIFTIAFRSLTGFFENLPVIFKCFLPPVLLQILAGVILGLGMFFGMTAIVSGNTGVSFIGFIIAIAATVILCKSIWDFLVRMGALVLISKQIVENEPLRKIGYYVDAFKNRKGYIMYLLITGFLIPLIPFIFALPKIANIVAATSSGLLNNSGVLADFAVVLLIFAGFTLVFGPFLVVTLQSFVLNPKLSPWEAIVKGMELSGGKYFQSLGLFLLHSIIVGAVSLLLSIFVQMVSMATGLPKEIINVVVQLVSQFLCGYTILCFTWWYLRLEKEAR